MNYDQIYAIATQGMNVEKLRVDVVANNIANQHSLKSADGNLFQASQVITTAKPFSDFLDGKGDMGIDSIELVAENLPPNKVYQPGHPAADKQGYLTYPGVNTIDEMTTLLRASRAYEANIKIINTAHNLYLQALSIGEER
ncbi:flagellar basal body rod protein FlgC [Legionella maioricensis]|uniref:Flagellar basal-body rod protein FlgC n=1 Tax=Legionella maioricensis TaxID=2896528 RepID=A0A9X2CXI7_9GAMM|nr:flagellar basal body rod protein FlgC [Legionella maioricensis]MCL9682630.1 flagellar basal body rod protein FlgC [Legionella maioricensis]MCL9687323.1 flagellar basal body rod protein FlgC [Legionella maioricensis]